MRLFERQLSAAMNAIGKSRRGAPRQLRPPSATTRNPAETRPDWEGQLKQLQAEIDQLKQDILAYKHGPPSNY